MSSLRPPKVGAFGLLTWLHVLSDHIGLVTTYTPVTAPSLQRVFSPDFSNELQTHISYFVINNSTYRLLKFNVSKMEPMILLPDWSSFTISTFVNDITIHSDAHSRIWRVILCTIFHLLSLSVTKFCQFYIYNIHNTYIFLLISTATIVPYLY